MCKAFPSVLRNSQTGLSDKSPEELTKNGLKGPSLVIWIQVWVGAQDVLCPSSKHFRRDWEAWASWRSLAVVLISIKAHSIRMLIHRRLACQTSVPNVPSWDRQEKGKRPFPRLLCSYGLRVDVGSNYQMHATKTCTWNWGERKWGRGSRWQHKGHLLSGTDPGSCCVALEFPDPQIRQWWCDLAAACIQIFLFQKAKVVSVSYSPPCLSSFRTVSHNTHFMWLVWNLAVPTVIQRLRLGLPPRTCHLALPLVGKPHVQTHVTALCTLVSLVTWVLPLLYSHHPHCLPLLLVTYPLGEAQGLAQLETWGIPRTNRGCGLGCLPLNLSFGAKSQQWALRI